MVIAAPSVEDDVGSFSADSPPNSDDEQLDDAPFLSHQLPDDHESFSEKFLRNILTQDYQNLMPRRREKFVEITKTVTVTEIVNGAPDKHPASCEVKVTNVSPAGPHPVNVSIKHLHEKWRSCEDLDGSDTQGDLGKGTIIRIQETHKPFNYMQKSQKPNRFVHEDEFNSKVESSERTRQAPAKDSTLFNRSSDNIIDLEFRHPILVETSDQKMNGGSNGTRRRFADLRKKVSTTTKTSVTETEKVTTTRRSSSAHSTSSRRSYGKPEVHTLYYRKFVDEETKKGDDSSSDSGSVILHRDSVNRRSRSADRLSHSPGVSPVAPPRKRLGREESLHYYRDDEEVIREMETGRRVTVKTPEPRITSVSMNDTYDQHNLTAGITSVEMNHSCTDTSFESRFSTFPRARSSPPASQKVNHIHVNVIGPTRTPEEHVRHPEVGRVGEEVTMDIFLDSRRRASAEAPPKPPRRSKWEEHHHIGEPMATSTPMTTIERKRTREERVSTESGQSSRKSTRSSRPPDINIIECESFLRETRSPARTPATPIVVINQTPSSRRGSQDLLGEPGQRRRKSTVTDIDWYAAFNMKDPSSPTKTVKPPFGAHGDERKSSKDVRRRASDSSMIGVPSADIDLNQIFSCSAPQIKKDEKCQCNACRLIRMSEAERASRLVRESRTRQSRSYSRTQDFETRSSTLPSRHRTAPVEIRLEDVFNPKSPTPVSSKPPTPPTRRSQPLTPSSPPPAPSSSVVDEPPSRHAVTLSIDRSQVTPVTNSRDSQLHARNQLLPSSPEDVDWVGQMMQDANEWESKTMASRKSSTASSVARKVSVARRISVDELTNPERKKSRGAVPLPPSDVTIDDIFTALTQKKEEGKEILAPERRTFIVTRKQRAQDVDPIDFEKDRIPPVAPPRSKKTNEGKEEGVVVSETKVVLEDQSVVPGENSTVTSTANVSSDDVFAEKKGKEENETVLKRVFEGGHQEKLVSSAEEKDEQTNSLRKVSAPDSKSSTRNAFNPEQKPVEFIIPLEEPSVTSTASVRMRPSEARELPTETESKIKEDTNRTSAVSINLEEVFVKGPVKDAKEDDEDAKIRQRIAEFEKATQEKEAQRTGVVANVHPGKRLLDESNISMDDVFNTSQHVVSERSFSKDPNVITSASIVLSKEPEEDSSVPFVMKQTEQRRTSAASINLDDVFVTGAVPREDVEDEEDKKIRKRIAEFERSKQEKEAQKTIEESHSSRKLLEQSNVSMDDVFNFSQNKSVGEPEDEVIPSSVIGFSKQSEEVTSTETDIKFDEIFLTTTVSDEPEDDKTKELSEELKKTREEMGSPIGEKRQLSNVSVANSPVGSDEHPDAGTTGYEEKPQEMSAANISLNDVFTIRNSSQRTRNEEDEDEKIRRRVAEFEEGKKDRESRSLVSEHVHSSKNSFEQSEISLDDVFGTPVSTDALAAAESSKGEDPPFTTPSYKSPRVEVSNPSIGSPDALPEQSLSERLAPVAPHDDFSDGSSFDSSCSEEEPITIVSHIEVKPKGFASEGGERPVEIKEENETTKIETTTRTETTSETLTRRVHNSNYVMSDIFEPTSGSSDEKLDKPSLIVETGNHQPSGGEGINLEEVFVKGPVKDAKEDDEDAKIRQRIAEFEKATQEKEAQRTGVVANVHPGNRLLDESNISMDDVFNTSQPVVERSFSNDPNVITSASIVLSKEPEDDSSVPFVMKQTEQRRASAASINLDDVFVTGAVPREDVEDEEDKKIRKRIAEFERSKQEKEAQKTGTIEESHSSRKLLEQSNVSMDDVFRIARSSERNERVSTRSNASSSVISHLNDVSVGRRTKEEDGEDRKEITRRVPEFEKSQQEMKKEVPEGNRRLFEDSNISMDVVFNTSRQKDPGNETEEVFVPTRDRQPTLDDLFGPQTATPPPAIPTLAITSYSEDRAPSPCVLSEKPLSGLHVPRKWNESMMSIASTISLDDSFNNSFVASMNEPKMRKKELTLPVNNWIDDLVAKTTEEATREAPKTPRSGAYFPSPTRISQEIKYEWVADLAGRQKETTREVEEEHQTEEEHLQKQDNTWVSSVVYRPTLETSAYTLRASQQSPELDMDRVFSECLVGEKKDNEECECSACRLTEQEMEAMRKRQIETENMTREARELREDETKRRQHAEIADPSEFSIEDVFHPEVPLHIQTGHGQVPSTSSPPLQSTRTYYLSPRVSETVTTTHQWKDADIPIDEIFSPVSTSTSDNRRFSNFYEDRSGWDTMGSEDSGVMSGGGGRRRSSRTTDHVIDEAFKGIFDTQTTTSTLEKQEPAVSHHFDDYYITSLNERDVEATDSEVDGENLDVTQFVDDILGKSMDEAAFLSSTKSLRDHTDTSIDRKKSGDRIHPYYRTRTDTSIDRRSKPEVIKEDHETQENNDEIMKLVFVDRSAVSKSESRTSLSKTGGTNQSDEELLEIEIKPDYFLIKGSYSLLIPKSDPLGQLLQKLRDQNDSLATLDFSLTRKLKKLLVSCIREKAGSPMPSSSECEGLSSRGQSLIESIDHASSTFLRMNVDKFEPTRNPRGIVNFCTAENNICTPLLEERFKHLDLFFPNTEHLVRYPPAGGWPEAREVLVKYFKEFMAARVTIDELVLTASTRTGYDVVSYCLFEQDDVLLTNGPVYTGTISNVNERAQCVVMCVETDLTNPRLEVKKYEEALAEQNALDNTVAGVIIVNPHNPLGATFPPEDVVNLCNWAASKNLHVVIDEVFANCVFDKSASKFRPFLSYRHRVHRPENVAWLWSVSKDFGLPGLKFAVIHSANEGLRQAAMKLQLYHPCSPFVQDFAVKLLSDSEWLRGFHKEVTRRMAIHYRYTAENLQRLEIPFVPAQAGIFVFADFSKMLNTADSAGELELFERFAAAGVMLTPGVHQKCHVFGWFRLVFACSKQELEEGFRRMYSLLGSKLHPVGTVQY